MIDITGLDKAEVLYALVYGTRPLGLGVLAARNGFTMDDARALVSHLPQRFDYVAGRPLKLEMTETAIIDEWLYDRDAGQGACARVIEKLRGI